MSKENLFLRFGVTVGFCLLFFAFGPKFRPVWANPVSGWFDSITCNNGQVHARGWAIDQGSTNNTIDVHLYGALDALPKANLYRGDLCSALPGPIACYHAFDWTGGNLAPGSYTEWAAGIDMWGSPTNLSGSPKTFSCVYWPTGTISGPMNAVGGSGGTYTANGNGTGVNKVEIYVSPTSTQSWTLACRSYNSSCSSWINFNPGSYYVVTNAYTSSGGACSGNPWCAGGSCSGWADCGPSSRETVTVCDPATSWPNWNTITCIPNSGTCGAGTQTRTNTCSGAVQTQGCTINCPPVINSVTISSSPVHADNTTRYTITETAIDGNGGGDIYREYALIDYQGEHPVQRGYLTWALPDYWPTYQDHQACTGGGYAVIQPGYGNTYIHLDSCSTSVSGNTRTVNFVVRFATSFAADGPQIDNDISGYTMDASGAYNGWTNYQTNFNLFCPATVTVSGVIGGLVSPTTSSVCVNPQNCSVPSSSAYSLTVATNNWSPVTVPLTPATIPGKSVTPPSGSVTVVCTDVTSPNSPTFSYACVPAPGCAVGSTCDAGSCGTGNCQNNCGNPTTCTGSDGSSCGSVISGQGPGVAQYGNSISTDDPNGLTPTKVSTKEWMARGQIPAPIANKYNFDYWNKLLGPGDVLTNPNINSNGNSINDLMVQGAVKIYSLNGNALNIVNDQMITKSGAIIFLVNGGNIEIKSTIVRKNKRTFIAFITNKDIEVQSNLNNGSSPALDGVFLADGVFRDDLNYSSGYTPQLIANGIFAASSFQFTRNLGNGFSQNQTIPAELFTFDPSLVLAAPSIVARPEYTWQEVAP